MGYIKTMRRIIICLVFIFLFLTWSCQFPPDSVLTLESYKYFVRLPEDYNPQNDYPLILFLHGRGGGSLNFHDFDSYGMGDYANLNSDFPFIVVAPQTSGDWYTSLLDQTLEEITHAYSIDTNRIYITGFSMGGHGTYLMAFEYPERFAAIAPVAGYGNTAEAYKLTDLPVWIFHDIGDPVVEFSYAQAMYDSLLAYGVDVQLTTYNKSDHNSWYETYTNPELYEWFLSHEK
jgi:predicted peptidase